MDTVYVLPKVRERDLFTLNEENGYVFCRRSVDDKFGTTRLTTTLQRFKAKGRNHLRLSGLLAL
jgi:hypothetical protein